jgi:hypothetical protein
LNTANGLAYGKTLLHYVVFSIVALLAFSATVSVATEVTIRPVKDWQIKYVSSLPHELEVVNLKERLTEEQVTEPGVFILRLDEEPDKSVTFKFLSLWDADDDNPNIYGAVTIVGDFDLGASYKLTVNYPTAGTETYDVKVDETVQEDGPAFTFTRFSEASRLSVDIYTPDDIEALGFNYNAALSIFGPSGAAKKANVYRLNLISSGNISTDLNVKSLQTNMNNGAEFKLFKYPIGGRGTFEFETNQDWSIIDMAAKGEGVLAIPYFFNPALIFWHKLTDTNRIFFPPTVYWGYAYVYGVKDDLNDPPARENDHRLDFGANWNMPFTTKTDVAIKYSGVYFFKNGSNDSDKYKYYIDVRGKYYLDGNMSRGFEVGYQKGALPPEYKETETVLAGFTIKMF